MMEHADFSAGIWGRATFDTEQKAAKLVSHLVEHPMFAPDAFGSHEPLRPLSSVTMDDVIKAVVNRTRQQLQPARVWNMVMFRRRSRPHCSFAPTWQRLAHDPFSLSLYGLESSFITNATNLSKWLEFVERLLELHDAWFARVCLTDEAQAKNRIARAVRTSGQARSIPEEGSAGLKLHQGIPGIYWGNYFGPFYVDWFGRDRLEKMPCVESKWLKTGGMFFTTAPKPAEWVSPGAAEMERAIKEHLGADAFFDVETVRKQVEVLDPMPEETKLEQLQLPRRVPEFPFEIAHPSRKSLDEEVQDLRDLLEPQGLSYAGLQGDSALFRDGKGGTVYITMGPIARVEYRPKR